MDAEGVRFTHHSPIKQMNPQLDKILCETFPKLYSKRRASMIESCMHWGFECGDGWFLIVWQLSEQLEKLGCVAAQVKEKFGGLRFYLEGYTDEAVSAIEMAEERALRTCDVCGDAGSINNSGWLSVRCDDHKKQAL